MYTLEAITDCYTHNIHATYNSLYWLSPARRASAAKDKTQNTGWAILHVAVAKHTEPVTGGDIPPRHEPAAVLSTLEATTLGHRTTSTVTEMYSLFTSILHKSRWAFLADRLPFRSLSRLTHLGVDVSTEYGIRNTEPKASREIDDQLFKTLLTRALPRETDLSTPAFTPRAGASYHKLTILRCSSFGNSRSSAESVGTDKRLIDHKSPTSIATAIVQALVHCCFNLNPSQLMHTDSHMPW